MNNWKGAFVAALLSGVVLGILNGHLAVWTAIGAALGAVLASRERLREAAGIQTEKAHSSEMTQGAGK